MRPRFGGNVVQIPRRFLLNDEGSAALHYLDLDAPAKNWSFSGPGRDLQPIGQNRVLRSTPAGFVELELEGGRLVREVELDDDVGGVESARRLPNGHTVLLGNLMDGIVLTELDAQAATSIDASKGRLLPDTYVAPPAARRVSAGAALTLLGVTAAAVVGFGAIWFHSLGPTAPVAASASGESAVVAERIAALQAQTQSTPAPAAPQQPAPAPTAPPQNP